MPIDRYTELYTRTLNSVQQFEAYRTQHWLLYPAESPALRRTRKSTALSVRPSVLLVSLRRRLAAVSTHIACLLGCISRTITEPGLQVDRRSRNLAEDEVDTIWCLLNPSAEHTIIFHIQLKLTSCDTTYPNMVLHFITVSAIKWHSFSGPWKDTR